MLIHEKLAYNYFHKLFNHDTDLTKAFHILDENEQKKIRQIERRASLYAALFGAMGVVFLYLPVHLNNNLFPTTPLTLPWVGKVIFPWAYTLYMIFLAIAEIFALTWLNLVIVYKICRVCGFPNKQDTLYNLHIQTLFETSLDKNNKKVLAFGINPFVGLPTYNIIFFSTLFILKATLSNFAIKFALTRLLSQFAIVGYHYYADYTSLFVFAAWNVYATHFIVQSAKVRVMAPSLIYQLTERLHREFKDNLEFKEMLLDTLQFIAIAKRNFHHNHYLLADRVITAFELPYQSEIRIKRTHLLEKIKSMPISIRQGLAKLCVLGILLDGQVSKREVFLLKNLQLADLWQLTPEKLKEWGSDFLAGRGLDELFQKGVPLSNT